jgi:hypothetical protein
MPKIRWTVICKHHTIFSGFRDLQTSGQTGDFLPQVLRILITGIFYLIPEKSQTDSHAQRFLKTGKPPNVRGVDLPDVPAENTWRLWGCDRNVGP